MNLLEEDSNMLQQYNFFFNTTVQTVPVTSNAVSTAEVARRVRGSAAAGNTRQRLPVPYVTKHDKLSPIQVTHYYTY
jgi:hypothetical protein